MTAHSPFVVWGRVCVLVHVHGFATFSISLSLLGTGRDPFEGVESTGKENSSLNLRAVLRHTRQFFVTSCVVLLFGGDFCPQRTDHGQYIVSFFVSLCLFCSRHGDNILPSHAPFSSHASSHSHFSVRSQQARHNPSSNIGRSLRDRQQHDDDAAAAARGPKDGVVAARSGHAPALDQPQRAADPPSDYELAAVIEHSGSAWGGHFATYRCGAMRCDAMMR